jgi:hypothetical protein
VSQPQQLLTNSIILAPRHSSKQLVFSACCVYSNPLILASNGGRLISFGFPNCCRASVKLLLTISVVLAPLYSSTHLVFSVCSIYTRYLVQASNGEHPSFSEFPNCPRAPLYMYSEPCLKSSEVPFLSNFEADQ